MSEKRLTWKINNYDDSICDTHNGEGEWLGFLKYERVGAHMHWCWYQFKGIRMSPGCLQEVRDKQKELLKGKRKNKEGEKVA